MRLREWIGLILIVVVCLLGGFFAGREHMRYQIEAQFEAAGGALANRIAPRTVQNLPPPPQETKKDQPIEAKFLAKRFIPSNPDAGEYRSLLSMTFSFTNRSTKAMRAFDGAAYFTDLLDNPILSTSFAINQEIAPSGTYSWDGVIEYNQFVQNHIKFRNEEFDNMKFRMVLRKVLFADGATVTYAE